MAITVLCSSPTVMGELCTTIKHKRANKLYCNEDGIKYGLWQRSITYGQLAYYKSFPFTTFYHPFGEN